MAYKLAEVDNAGSRAEKLHALTAILANEIDICDDPKLVPQLARQYRETLRELAEIAPEKKEAPLDDILGGIEKVR